MSAATEATNAYVQAWDDDPNRWWRTAPRSGSVAILPAVGFPAAVNARLASATPAEVVVLSDGFGLVSPLDLDRLVVAARDDGRVVRARGGDLGTDVALLAAPGALLADLGLHPGLSTYYWADELERATPSVELEIAWVEYDEPRRLAELGARYYQAIADLGVLESEQR